MSKISKIIYFFVTTVFFILTDVFLSGFAITNGYKLPKNPFFELIFISNEGAAFSLFEGFKTFLVVFSLIALLCIIFSTVKRIKKVSSLGIFLISMLNAGIFCNMAERLIFGYVRDYIKLNFIDFPVFNISDMFINISVAVLIFIIAKNRLYKKTEK